MGAFVARAGRYGATADYPATANAQTCVLVQAESGAAMAELEAIAAVEGVDGVFIGPADLGADTGYRDEPAHPDLWAGILDGIARIRAAGKAAGILVTRAEAEAGMIEAGVTFLGCGSDALILQAGLAALAGARR
jgi:4-hydroxy-2-oxoheptanedioate aldolase